MYLLSMQSSTQYMFMALDNRSQVMNIMPAGFFYRGQGRGRGALPPPLKLVQVYVYIFSSLKIEKN